MDFSLQLSRSLLLTRLCYTTYIVVFDAILYQLSTSPYLWTSLSQRKAIYFMRKVSENNLLDYLQTFNENIFLERCSTFVTEDLALL